MADLRSACDYMTESIESPPERLILVGYSYGSLVVSQVAPHVSACAAFVMIAPPLGITLPLFGPRFSTPDAAASPKHKLALCAAQDQFCSVARFEEWACTLRSPAEHHIVLGREMQMPCCHGDHHHCHAPRRQRVHHFNLFGYLEEYLAPWVRSVFGCEPDALGQSSGEPVAEQEMAPVREIE